MADCQCWQDSRPGILTAMATLVLTLAIVSAVVLALLTFLAQQIRQDGLGHRPPPRSREDEVEPRWLQLAKLAR